MTSRPDSSHQSGTSAPSPVLPPGERPRRGPTRASGTNERPTIRLRDPAGVVAAVPYLLGFTPRRSLVVLGGDATGAVGPTIRWDWSPGDSSTAEGWWHAVDVMRRNGCARVLAVAYTDADPLEVAPAARAALLDVVLADTPPESAPPVTAPTAAPGPTGAPAVLDVLLVGPQRFTSLVCHDVSCCPAPGLPVRDTDSHPVAAAFVVSGRSPAPDRESLEPADTAVTADDRRAAAAAAAQARARWRADEADDVVELLELWRSSLPAGPAPAVAGRLLVAWTRLPRLRDACLSVFLPAGPSVMHVLLGSVDAAGPGLDDALSDPGCAEAAQAGGPALRRLAGLAEGRERATVLAAHAWLAWVSGEGSSAGVLAERALADDEEQSLAGLVLRCLQHGLGAPWTLAGPGAS